MVSQKESVAIAELVIYPPVLFGNLFILFRNRTSPSGWIYLALFALIRIIGAGMEIAAVENPNNVSDLEGTLILQSIGLAPLLMSSLGLLKQVIDASTATQILPESSTERKKSKFEVLMSYTILGRILNLFMAQGTAPSFRGRLIQVMQLPNIVALVLCIIGGTDLFSSNPSDVSTGKGLVKGGIIIFVVMYAALVIFAVKSVTELSKAPSAQKRLLAVILAALPFILVRLVWSMLAYFSDIPRFNAYYGSTIIRVFMATFEEFIVVIAYTFVGFSVINFGSSIDTDTTGSETRAKSYEQHQGIASGP